MLKILTKQKAQLFIIVIATVLVYINTLPNGLVWDDHLFVEKWKDMQNFDIVSLVKGSAPQAQGRLYRPVRSIIYAIDYKLWGQNPFFYHLQALLIHLACTILVFFIAKKIFNNLTIKQSNNDLLAFMVSLFFGLHPIHTETIDYISASLETFGSLFFFLSFYLYLVPARGGTVWHLPRPRLARLGSIVSALLAFFTYEMTLTLPLLIVLYEYVSNLSRHSFRKSSYSNFQFSIFNFQFRRIVPYFALAFFYVFVRIFVFGIAARTEYLAYSFYHTMLAMVKVFAQYILLLFFPFNLTTNHRLVGDFPSSMLPYDKLDPILRQSIFDWDVLLGILVILGILGLAWIVRKKFPLITFCIGWFFISLLPVSYIIPHGGAMAEKYLYIASFGFVVIVAFVILNLFQNHPLPFPLPSRERVRVRGFGMTILLLLALFYGILTVQRNTVWRNDITLFTDMEKKAPNNLLATYTLGVLYGERNHFDIAQSYYLKAINKAPDFWEAHYNLGNIYTRVGREVLAKKEYEKVLQINKDFTPARNNLDLLSRHSGKPDLSGSPSPAPVPSPLEGEGQGEGGRHDRIRYSLNEISFEYPKDWRIERFDRGVRVKNKTGDFVVEITLDKKEENVSTNEYIAQSKESFGKLMNQGLAKVPEFDFAYVKVWEGKLQFFLFKKDLVIKMLVYPADSAKMKEFDTILGSIKLI